MTQSPMSRSQKVGFLGLAITVMFFFAMTAIELSKHSYTWAGTSLVLALLLAGSGFMVRKRILRRVTAEV